MRALATALIRGYQLGLSPYLGHHCRFHPSCSEYSLQCFSRFTFLSALWYSFSRIIRCHPWSAGGHDPVPGCSCSTSTPLGE